VTFLSKLNPQQHEAVVSTEGPLLILAGAGSGKTRVITYRIAYLIEEKGVPADAILAVTFTNKAAAEMAERVEKIVGHRSVARPAISTFHSLCVRMLRRDIDKLQINGVGYKKDFVIYDDSDQQMVVKAAMRRLGIDDKQMRPQAVLGRISWAKNHMLDPQEIYLQSADPKTEKIAHIYEIYRQELRRANALDFDDLLLEAVRLLKAVPEVRHYYNRRFQYLLVDEYQDTNRPQYELMLLLAGEHHNVCVVGDEDQSIYSWRGADIRNILEFEKDFPEAKIIRLEENYRSTQNILQAASAVVANNVRRKGKTLWTSRQGGPKIGYYEAPDGENEALFVADYISKYTQQRAHEGDNARAAVLYRTNAQSRLFEEAMRRYGLKYHVVGGFSFYDRAEIKDMISYLKVVLNPDDTIALQRIINTPSRGIGKSSMETLERIALETGVSLWGALGQAVEGALLPSRAVSALRGFRDMIEGGRAMLAGNYLEWLGSASDETQGELEDRVLPETLAEECQQHPSNAAEMLKSLIDRSGYMRALEEEDTPEAQSRTENLRELVNAAMDSRDRGESLQEFLDHAALVSDTDSYDQGAQITLMTLHSAKGLEFPLVLLVGMEEGLFPHSRTFLNPDDIEEERRLCYVGMTRAMDALILSRARYRRRYGTDMPEASTASRFLEEVPPQLLEDLGSPRGGALSRATERWDRPPRDDYTSSHYAYEDEDQRPVSERSKAPAYSGKAYNSIDNIAEFFASRGKKLPRPKVPVAKPTGGTGFRPGQRVRHPKYGEGTIFKREGEGDDAKLTVQFPRHGLKKLVEKYAQLERC
jgi:DNA helicase-2/ATP-dependent DNA helicase PcrA